MKFWMFVLAMPSMVLAFSPTPKENCSPIDLRNSTLGDVRNQKNISWCYSFTGADMLAHAFDESEKISAADMAISYNESQVGIFSHWLSVNILNRNNPEYTRTPHQTGFNKLSLMKTLGEGWCPENVFPSEAWTKVTRDQDGETEENVTLDVAMHEISALHDIRQSLNLNNLPFYYRFKHVDAAKFLELLQVKRVNEFYFGLRKITCKDDRHEFTSIPKVKMVIKNPKIFRRVSEQLESGQMVGLDYTSKVFAEPGRRGLSFANLHTSGLVGRRWNTTKKTCEYLVRNSYGSDCENGRYHQSLECENGNIWLTESQIYKSMTSIVYLLMKR